MKILKRGQVYSTHIIPGPMEVIVLHPISSSFFSLSPCSFKAEVIKVLVGFLQKDTCILLEIVLSEDNTSQNKKWCLRDLLLQGDE